MRHATWMGVMAVAGLATAGCVPVYHAYFGYGDKSADGAPVAFDRGQLTSRLHINVNQYYGSETSAKATYGVRNTSGGDACVSVGFTNQDIAAYRVPPLTRVFVRRGRTEALPIGEVWAQQSADQWLWPKPFATSMPGAC